VGESLLAVLAIEAREPWQPDEWAANSTVVGALSAFYFALQKRLLALGDSPAPSMLKVWHFLSLVIGVDDVTTLIHRSKSIIIFYSHDIHPRNG